MVPANTNVVCDVTSVDVNHAWWIPAFGVKIDAVPGRITQLWFNVHEEDPISGEMGDPSEVVGWYKGQCAELCGDLHARMLIDVYVVHPDEYQEWVEMKAAEFAGEGEEETPEETQPDQPETTTTDNATAA